MEHRAIVRLKNLAPWLVLTVFLVAPLYLISTALAIRSGLLDLSDRTVGADEYKALWGFVASGLATVATTVGLLLTKAHNERTLASQQDLENKKMAYQVEADRRLALDTVVKGLELIAAGPDYAPSAKVAGALAALVHMGHPVIAMRALDSAWDDGAVDAATGCWLISEVFREGSKESILAAARLLQAHARELCAGEACPGQFNWPDILYDRWPADLPYDARADSLVSLIDVLTSRSLEWWETSFGWIFVLLYLVIENDPDNAMKSSAAEVLRRLVTGFSTLGIYGLEFMFDDQLIGVPEFHRALEDDVPPGNMISHKVDVRLPEIDRWLASADEQRYADDSGLDAPPDVAWP
jgi:hypothetical protein